MPEIRSTLNGRPTVIDTDPERTLLWVLRTDLGLTGTKCGATRASAGPAACWWTGARFAVRSGVNSQGQVILWDYQLLGGDNRGPNSGKVCRPTNHRTRRASWRGPLSTGACRAPGAPPNGFARESQTDIMAARTRIDPVQFRLNHLGSSPRIRYTPATSTTQAPSTSAMHSPSSARPPTWSKG